MHSARAKRDPSVQRLYRSVVPRVETRSVCLDQGDTPLSLSVGVCRNLSVQSSDCIVYLISIALIVLGPTCWTPRMKEINE
jgi:hypothetical protein